MKNEKYREPLFFIFIELVFHSRVMNAGRDCSDNDGSGNGHARRCASHDHDADSPVRGMAKSSDDGERQKPHTAIPLSRN
jgi:hypothetical protein